MSWMVQKVRMRQYRSDHHIHLRVSLVIQLEWGHPHPGYSAKRQSDHHHRSLDPERVVIPEALDEQQVVEWQY